MATIRQIQTYEQIQRHLSLIYHFQPSIWLNFADTWKVKVTRLIYDDQRPEEILLKTMPLTPEPDSEETATITYIFNGFKHHFAARILTIKSLGGIGAFIKIQIPQIISAVNRRNYLRWFPDKEERIEIKFELPGGSVNSIEAHDISAGGVSLLLPSDHAVVNQDINEMEVELYLPDRSMITAGITVRNKRQLADRQRFGAEFTCISLQEQKKLMNFIIQRALNRRGGHLLKSTTNPPLLCLIQDNCGVDEILAYLEQPYRLVRQDINADWESIRGVSPDVLLFNLDSIEADTLLSKLRKLSHFQNAPAIIMAEQEPCDLSCDATFLAQLKDPAVLIEAIEKVIEPELEINLSKPVFPGKNPSIFPKPNRIILILDLKQSISPHLVKAIESRSIEVEVRSDLHGVFKQIKQVNPILITIHSDFDATLNNFFQMLKINKYAHSIPLAILADNPDESISALKQKVKQRINIVSKELPTDELVRQLIAYAQARTNAGAPILSPP